MFNYDGAIPLGGLRGLALDMVCIAPFALALHFGDGKVVISTTEESIYDSQSGIRQKDGAIPVLHRLLGKTVAEAHEEHGPDILLIFEDGEQLLVRTVNSNTESYTLSIEGCDYIR